MDALWQVQEAKQRFSEILRRAQSEGPQFVTRHAKQVAVVMDIEEFRTLVGQSMDFKEYLLSMPKSDDDEDIFERSRDLMRDVDLGEAL